MPWSSGTPIQDDDEGYESEIGVPDASEAALSFRVLYRGYYGRAWSVEQKPTGRMPSDDTVVALLVVDSGMILEQSLVWVAFPRNCQQGTTHYSMAF